jgi:hypothetical protein
LFYQLLVYRRCKGEAKGFTWQDYRDLIIATITTGQPAHWCCNDLSIHLGPELGGFAAKVTSAWPGRSVSACGRSIFG